MADPTEASAAYRPVPGPVDRTTFFEAQRRNRRASRQFSIAAAVCVFLTGLPLSVVFTPFVYAACLVIGYVASAISPAPLAAFRVIRDLPFVLAATGGIQTAIAGGTRVTLEQAALITLVLTVPGAICLLLVWISLRLVFRHAGVGGVLLTLGARAPNPSDLEEQQLANVVGEMAIAAGVPAPRLMLIDTEAADGAANAAAVGWSIADATIVVSRPLLDQLNRDETQSVVARLIATVGNGDLKIALIILSLLQTVGFATLVLNSVFGSQSRHALAQLIRLTLTPRRAANRAALESDVMNLLARGADTDSDMNTYLSKHQDPKGCFAVLQLPLILGVGFPIFTSNFIVSMSGLLVTGPMIGALWKRRELLADATAVQLTRNPDGLASALERLADLPVRVPRASAISYLFAVWESRTGLTPQQAAIFRQAVAEAPDSPLARARALQDIAAVRRAQRRAGAPVDDPDQADRSAGAVEALADRMHAKFKRRIAQLLSLGAHVDAMHRPAVTPADRVQLHGRTVSAPLKVFGVGIIVVLGVLVAGLLGVAFVLIMGLDVLFTTIMLMIVWLVCKLAFVVVPGALKRR